jgi:hypothetical protein
MANEERLIQSYGGYRNLRSFQRLSRNEKEV